MQHLPQMKTNNRNNKEIEVLSFNENNKEKTSNTFHKMNDRIFLCSK